MNYQNQLKRITDHGMTEADGKRTKYTIFGHEFVLKDQISDVAGFVKTVKSVVDEAVKVSPEASLAWAGVCVLLPVFTNPSVAEEANRNGLSYVTSRLRYYVELEPLLLPENIESKELRGEFERHVVDLYQKILQFQIKTVLRFYRGWLANISRDVIGSDDWEGMVSKIKDLEQTVRDESNTMNTIASRERLGDIHNAAQQHDKKLQSLLAVAEEHLLVSKEHREISSGQLSEHKQTKYVSEPHKLVVQQTNNLPVVHEARYDSADVQDSPKCYDGTRISIRDKINHWADEDSQETLLWLVGPAGTGKSTLARTVADFFAKKSQLVAAYFFKRGQQSRNDTSRIFPTLAVQMMETIPSFKGCLVKHLDGLSKDAVEKKALEFQFDKLLRHPLADLPHTHTKQLPMIIIIDALDECERPEHLAEILGLLSELRIIPQVRLRVILTSRSAPSIGNAFDPLLTNNTARRLEIHREFLQDTKKDIRIFLETNFTQIRLARKVNQNPWPSAEDMDRLVQLATSPEPLFIYAATLCRFVYDQKQPRNPKRQLDKWLVQCEDGKSQLDQIYSPILAQVFADHNNAESEQQLQFLGALVLLVNPISAFSLAAVLGIDTDDITWWLSELHEVLDIPSDSERPLRLLHKSFSDFLLDSDTCSASPYRVDVAKTHSLLAEKCVQRMEAGLRQDICDVGELDATIDEVPEERMHRCIPEDLEYACLHWVYHLKSSGQPPSTDVLIFLNEHFLHWLEALSLLGRLSDGALAIGGLLEFIKDFPGTPSEFVDLVKDARSVISSFGSIIERAPLQTYGTLLFFTPVASKVRQMFWNQRMPRLDPIQGVKMDWDAHLQTLEGHDNFILAIAFSPDSQVIASGSGDATVRLWSANTGAHLHTLEGHSSVVSAVVFFDNETLASGSYDGTKGSAYSRSSGDLVLACLNGDLDLRIY
ncbi:hypothetical protein KVR01_009417 [Diaporthe batatas]|uniref:uncharacterized protein n=1 Tax=Diaporthe batatas TaxID=748121 RepID=UPI001D03E7BE|nr:uncharacterized protein KVR01_009417 [Diaporthe batatas]KAG8161153.1 hypothetical protein KVR01_009417 [Diaporthe batatas]